MPNCEEEEEEEEGPGVLLMLQRSQRVGKEGPVQNMFDGVVRKRAPSSHLTTSKAHSGFHQIRAT